MITLCEYSIDFLEYSWNWLNDPEIKKDTNTHDFSKDDQIQWFKNIKNSSGYYIWGLKLDGVPVGACGLKKVNETDGEYWGYIGEKKFWGKGLGHQMMLLMINEAKTIGLASIWLQVNTDNRRAIKLYLKTGFIVEREFNNLIIMRKQL